jgi:hypothetical protein
MDPFIFDHRIHSPAHILPSGASVAALMNPATGWWNYELINDVFTPTNATKICSVVPSPLCQEDKLIWTGSKNRCFSVRSAYYMEMERRNQDSGESSNSGENQNLWKAVWNWKCPLVIKNFLWKLGSNILATRENLFRKGILFDPFCPFCLVNSESVFHALWSCLASVAVWQ